MIAVDVVVPGRLDNRSGGSLYDAHAVAALRRRGVAVRVHELAGRFPDPDGTACREMTRALAAVGDDGVVVIDGLCLSAVAAVDAAEGTVKCRNALSCRCDHWPLLLS